MIKPVEYQWLITSLLTALILLPTLRGLAGNPTGQALYAFLEIQIISWLHLSALKKTLITHQGEHTNAKTLHLS